MTRFKELVADTSGDAIVEATILFPIMIMIFAALVLLAVYLPQRALLQEAAQFTAVAIATENSDTYLAFDETGKRIKAATDNVYVATVRGIMGSNLDLQDKAYSIASHVASGGVLSISGELEVALETVNYVIYQQVTVRLSQKIAMPVNLSFIGFPTELVLVQEASAVVQNGDEFVRNVDIAKDLVLWLDRAMNLSGTLRETGALDHIDKVVSMFGLGG